MLTKSFAGLNRKPAKLIAILLLVGMMACILASSSAVKAAAINPKLTLSPTSGAVGSTVYITGTGYSPNEPATFLVGNQAFANATYSDANGKISTNTTVPNLLAGSYTILSYDASGKTTSAAFTVTGGGTATPIPATTSSGNGNNNGNGNGNTYPTYTPTSPPTSSSGFFSPLVTVIIVVVLIAVIIPLTLMFRGQGNRRRMAYERERERERESQSYGPGPYGGGGGGGYGAGPQQNFSSQAPGGGGYGPASQNYGPAPQNYGPPPSGGGGSRYSNYSYRQSSAPTYSRYGSSQPVSGYRSSSYASRYSQPQSSYRPQQSGYSKPSAPSKTCPHCKRSVRIDQNVCPYCNKRI